MRVDDYFKFGCGDIIREIDGRHLYRVDAVIFNTIVARSLDNGWRAEFQSYEVVKEKTP